MVAVSLPGVVRCPSVVGREGELAAIGGLLDAVGSGCGGALTPTPTPGWASRGDLLPTE